MASGVEERAERSVVEARLRSEFRSLSQLQQAASFTSPLVPQRLQAMRYHTLLHTEV